MSQTIPRSFTTAPALTGEALKASDIEKSGQQNADHQNQQNAKDKLEGEWSKLLLCAELDRWKQRNEGPTRQKVQQGAEKARERCCSAERRRAQKSTQNCGGNMLLSEDSLWRRSGAFPSGQEANGQTVSSWNEGHHWKIRNILSTGNAFGDGSYWTICNPLSTNPVTCRLPKHRKEAEREKYLHKWLKNPFWPFSKRAANTVDKQGAKRLLKGRDFYSTLGFPHIKSRGCLG